MFRPPSVSRGSRRPVKVEAAGAERVRGLEGQCSAYNGRLVGPAYVATSLLCLSLIAGTPRLAAEEPPKLDGTALFRANCAFCHGADARGGRGPNLLGDLSHGSARKELEHTIREGVPGSEMPGFDFEPEEVGELVAYLVALRQQVAAPDPRLAGNPTSGKKVYRQQGCGACHQIGADGGVLGPDLSRIGASRPAAYLRQSVEEPSADVREDYASVQVTLRDGTVETGVRVNEDTFSVQMRLADQRIRSYDKRKDLRDIRYPKESVMPAYRLAAEDLENLVAYLASLRAPAAMSASGATEERGIR